MFSVQWGIKFYQSQNTYAINILNVCDYTNDADGRYWSHFHKPDHLQAHKPGRPTTSLKANATSSAAHWDSDHIIEWHPLTICW